MAETERPSPDRHRRRLGLLAAVAVVLAGIALIGSRLGAHSGPLTSIAPSPTSVSSLPSSGEPPPTQPAESAGVSSAPASASLGYLVLPADLADRASKAAQGVEPWQAAQRGLISDVDAALIDSVSQGSSVVYFCSAGEVSEGFAIALRAMGFDEILLSDLIMQSDITSNPEAG